MKEKYMHLSQAGKDKKEALERLTEIVGILRQECPWDKVQTHESLIPGMLEESYEVVEAINNKDKENLREELGDVLLQVVFHALIEEENENFCITDVMNDECEKMIRRHPHVFLEETANNNGKSIDKVLEKWENIKVQEKGDKSYTSPMQRVPKALPALMRAYKVQKKAAKAGFDWEDASGAFDKIREEYAELSECFEENPEDQEILTDEMGDLLFSCVNLSRFLGVDPERALYHTIDKFIRRFAYIEESTLACGRKLEEMSLTEMDMLWDEAKTKEEPRRNY